MKHSTKSIWSPIYLFLAVLICTVLINSCSVNQAIANKSGAQLWAENCQHCHNTPSPSSFSAEQWKTIGMHMHTRNLLTEAETKKIVDFLQQSTK